MVLVVLLAMTVGAAHVSAHSLCPRPGDIGSLAVAAQMIGGRIKPGRLFMYTYDGIGNRQWAVMGTPGGGSSQTKTAYTTNSKNQLTQAVNPGVAHVSGYAPADSRVEITYDTDTFAAVREGTYWYAAVPVDNSAAAVCASIHVTVIDEAGSVSHQETITRLVPKAVETISYDPRGNQTEDSIWEYTWDAMDRLAAVEMKEIAGADRVKVEFQYDFLGRRVTKKVYSYNDGWVPEYTRKFIWAGWLLQAETDGDDKLIRSYVWGRDVSGGVGGAAGIGGLLAVRTHNPADGAVTATYWVVSDEHGSVTSLVKAAAGEGGRETVAAFEYGPYGEVLAVDAGGGVGVTNATPTFLCPFLYSSKYYEEEIGLYYYGYRYYNPATGRWLNRDPLGETGCLNLYAFCEGQPTNLNDPLGLLNRLQTQWLIRQATSRPDWDIGGRSVTSGVIAAGIKTIKEYVIGHTEGPIRQFTRRAAAVREEITSLTASIAELQKSLEDETLTKAKRKAIEARITGLEGQMPGTMKNLQEEEERLRAFSAIRWSRGKGWSLADDRALQLLIHTHAKVYGTNSPFRGFPGKAIGSIPDTRTIKKWMDEARRIYDVPGISDSILLAWGMKESNWDFWRSPYAAGSASSTAQGILQVTKSTWMLGEVQKRLPPSLQKPGESHEEAWHRATTSPVTSIAAGLAVLDVEKRRMKLDVAGALAVYKGGAPSPERGYAEKIVKGAGYVDNVLKGRRLDQLTAEESSDLLPKLESIVRGQ